MANFNHHDTLHRIEDCLPSAEPREPQRNGAVCGCRCGCGGCLCEGSGGDGGNDADADKVYIQGEEGVENEPIHVDMPVPAPPTRCAVATLITAWAVYEVNGNEFTLGTAQAEYDDPREAASRLDELGRVQSQDSLANHFHSSDEPSLSSSGFLTRYSDSPGLVLRETGSWIPPSGYYFTASPLPCLPLAAPLYISSSVHFSSGEESDNISESEDGDDGGDGQSSD